MNVAEAIDQLVDMMVSRAALFELDSAPVRNAGDLFLEARALLLSSIATMAAPTPAGVEEHRDMALDLAAHMTRVKWRTERTAL